ncbi:MAG: hypothetical protein IPJ06_14885 [Saprospiraceae bacterium]|nr:hypothetical protein [Saprospiraceae bacterium]
MGYDIRCEITRFTAEIINACDLAPQKKTEILVLRNSVVRTEESAQKPVVENTPGSQTLRLSLPEKRLTVSGYRGWLTSQLQAVAGLDPDDRIELE